MQATGEPVILTQHGRSAAVLLDVVTYKGMLDGRSEEASSASRALKVVWSPLAEQRALEVVDCIAKDRPRTAVMWLEKLLERVGNLASFQQQGRAVQEIGLPAYREVLHAPYRVIHRVDATRVVILTLRHLRRAWDPPEVDDVSGHAATRSSWRTVNGLGMSAAIFGETMLRAFESRCTHVDSRNARKVALGVAAAERSVIRPEAFTFTPGEYAYVASNSSWKRLLSLSPAHSLRASRWRRQRPSSVRGTQSVSPPVFSTLRPSEQFGQTRTYLVPEARLQLQLPARTIRPAVGLGGGTVLASRRNRMTASAAAGVRVPIAAVVLRGALRVRGIGTSSGASATECTFDAAYRF